MLGYFRLPGRVTSNETLVASVQINAPAGSAVAANGIIANVYCQLLISPAQYGVTNQPVLRAIDVFALTPSPADISVAPFRIPALVCLQGTGALLYRNASNSPRVTVTLPSYAQGGFTCATIPNAGTLILVVGTLDGAAADPIAPSPATALSMCKVTSIDILNLHAAPDQSSAILDLVPNATTLKATTRQGNWLEVVFGNHQGWLIANYLTIDGLCG